MKVYRQSGKQLGKNLVACQPVSARVATMAVPDRPAQGKEVAFLGGCHPARRDRGRAWAPCPKGDGREELAEVPAAMHLKTGRSSREIAACIGENCKGLGVADQHPQWGISAIPRRKSQGPSKKMPLRTRRKIMVAVHKGPQAARCGADYRAYKSLCRHAKKPGLDIAYGAVRTFKETGLRNRIPRPGRYGTICVWWVLQGFLT